MENNNRVTLGVVIAVWVFLFAGTLLASRYVHHYWNPLYQPLLVLIALALISTLAYIVSVKMLGYKVNTRGMSFRKLIIGLGAGLVIFLILNSMAVVKAEMLRAGEVGAMDTVMAWNSLYTVLGVLVGMLFHPKGMLQMIRGNIRLNAYIIPALILFYLGSIYSFTAPMANIAYGLDQKGMLSPMTGVLDIAELHLVFLLLSGYLFIHALMRKEP